MGENKTSLYMLEAYTPYTTGCDTFMKEFMKGMLRHGGFNLHVIVEDSPVKNITKKHEAGITYIYFPETRQNKFAALETCMEKAVSHSSEMIFVSNFCPVIFNIKAIRKLFPHAKFVHVIHDLPWLTVFRGDENAYMDYIMGHETSSVNSRDGKFVKYCTYDIVESFKQADMIVCLCESTYQMLTDFYGIAHEKIRLIRNGMEDHVVSGMTKAARDFVKGKYNIPSDGLTVLLAGRLTYSKGADRISGMLGMLSKSISCNLVYAGLDDVDKWLPDHMQGSVTNIGFISHAEMMELYTVVDMGLFPSRHEQCSYVGIEFLMNGIPVIYVPDYGIRDMFRKEFSFEYSASTYSMITIGQIEAKKLAARNEYLKNYTAEKMNSRYVSLFRELISA